MHNTIFEKINDRIEKMDDGAVFVIGDFSDLAAPSATGKCLGCLIDSGKIHRIAYGIYEKPRYSEYLRKNIPPNPDDVANAIGRKNHWTVGPYGDRALNLLGLTTQVPAEYAYISSGPNRTYDWDGIKIRFEHRNVKDISGLSDITILVVEALRTLGSERATPDIIDFLSRRFSDGDKQILLKESEYVTPWIRGQIKMISE